MNPDQKLYTDFYCEDSDTSIRGVLVYQNIPQLISERLADDAKIDTPVSKWCSRFPRNIAAPEKPTDPLYVFSKWSFVCKADVAADLANLVLDAIEAVFTRKCEVTTSLTKCKISVTSSCGLTIKIKVFALPDDSRSYMVMFRKDSGDWFAFSSFFNGCLKFIENRGMSFSR
jgi:hypothetical protein